MGLEIYEWPGGFRSIAGGGRSSVNLDRPWQKEIEVDEKNCPFCVEGQNFDWFEEKTGGWRIRDNRYTFLHDYYHRMITPRHCWSASELRNLGGRDKIEAVLRIMKQEVDRNRKRRLLMALHIGALAGQNVSHLHYNLAQVMFDRTSLRSTSSVREKALVFFNKKSQLIILKNRSFIIGVGGVKTGQCFILPIVGEQDANEFAEQLAPLLHNLISLYNEKFRSRQGLAPDFSLGFYFQEGKETANFSYGVYTPVLNQWGGVENMMIYEEKSLFPLRWPHEVTVEHLKNSTISRS